MTPRVCRAVAIGGGTGLPNVLDCLLRLGCETTAVVTVADDGGSSGHLRREIGMLPPGDARNCLVAMADPDNPVARLFQYRFPLGEGLAGHALGNLIIAALADIEGSFPRALEDAANLLGARGRVLPSTLDDVVLVALDVEGTRIVGQVKVAENETPIAKVCYEGPEPDVYPPVVEALAAADLVVIGPGSLYTSILPNFLVHGVTEALRATPAKVVYVCNVANQRGETGGMDAADHVAALVDHGLDGVINTAVVHDTDAHPLGGGGVQPVAGGHAEVARIRGLGVEVLFADLVDTDDPRHHSRTRLLTVLERLV
ncbi:MAG: YvcK family protein [Coriobacteriia bacterium]|nr:YvcK family protein [Coriobacteriia bacterium]